MADLIERYKITANLPSVLMNYCNRFNSKQLESITEMIYELGNSIESADVQPAKHGYWEEVPDYGGWGDTHYRCSACGEEWYLEDGKPKDNNINFCPRCGAKMDAEPDEPWQSE